MFEYAVAVSLGILAFIQLYDWIEFRIALHEQGEEGKE